MRQAPRLILVSAGESVERVLLGGDPGSVLGSRRLAPDHGARNGGVVGVDEEGDRLPEKYCCGVTMHVCLHCITSKLRESRFFCCLRPCARRVHATPHIYYLPCPTPHHFLRRNYDPVSCGREEAVRVDFHEITNIHLQIRFSYDVRGQ